MGFLRGIMDATGYRSAWRHRDVRLLIGSQIISMTGSWAFNVALLAYVYQQTHSLGWVGLASALRLVPMLFLSPYGGVLAERFERRQVMMMSNVLALVWQALLAGVALANGSAALAIAFAMLTEASCAAYEPCVAATIPNAAGEADLPAANALAHTVENLVLLVGPALGALLLLAFSPWVVFAVNAASFGVAALMVRRMGVRSVPVDVTEGGTAGLGKQLAVGIRAILSSKRISVLVGATALGTLVYGADTVQLVGVASERLGMGSRGYGWLLAAGGVGGILGALAVDRMSRRPNIRDLIIGGFAAMCLPTLLLVVVRDPVVASALQVIRGAGMLIVDVLATIGLQRAVPNQQLGRVFGVLWAVAIGSGAVGAALMPPVIHAVGLLGSLWVMGLFPLAVALAFYPVLRAVDREAAAAARVLEPRVDMLAHSPLFEVADRVVLERLAAASEDLEVRAGTDVVRQGDIADKLYLVVSGSLAVSVTPRGGTPRVVNKLSPGDVFGEIGLLERIPRIATVTALESCRLMRIDGEAFLEALTINPLAALLEEMARARRTQTEESPDVTLEPAT
jgi:MFS family permease